MILITLNCSVYSNLGFGFASGCLIIIAEIIYAKLTRPRNLKSVYWTTLFLLTLSGIYLFIYLSILYLFIYLPAILTAGTVKMIQTYYDPIYYNIQKIQYYNPVVNFKFEKGKQCERFHLCIHFTRFFCEWVIWVCFFFRSFWHIPSSTGIIISLPCNLHFYISAAVLIFGGATAELYHPSSGASCILPTLQNETNFHSLEDYGLMCGGNTKKFKRYM